MGDRSQAIVSDAGDTDTRASLHAKTLLRALGVSAATWLGSELGHVARFPDIGAAIVFPPYAILTTVLLLTPPRRWWIYILAAFVGHVLTAPVSGDSVPAAFVASMEIANATRALTAVIMLRALGESRPRFNKLEGTAIFLVVAGVLAPAAGAFLGAAIVLAGPTERGIESYWRIWEAWFLSNAVTGVTLLPLMLVAAQRGLVRWRPANVRRVAEALILGSSV